MKKILKILLSIGFTAYFSWNMFYCFVAGAPPDKDSALKYMIHAGLFSLLLSSTVCGEIYYIRYLHKKLSNKTDD